MGTELTTGSTASGLATTGLTNCPGSNLALQGQLCAAGAAADVLDAPAMPAPVGTSVDSTADSTVDSWRVEVAARLERYRTRRKPRTPRYPSLLLPFDAPESWSRPLSSVASSVAATARADHDLAESIHEQTEDRYLEPAPEFSAKVIEFPRSAAIPVFHRSELADPIFDRPRIVEAPEMLPPPPALGGMLIEPARQETPDTEPAIASSSASIAQRGLAALVDGAVLATALLAMAAIFLRWNPGLIAGWITGLPTALSLNRDLLHGPLPIIAAALGTTGILLWTVYEFLFVVYTGSTPGLRAAHLQLASFTGANLDRRSRRWRVLASFLSAFSAGLGYVWCFLDQDGLCWHDRITRTHVRSSR
jgi:uncharacterized RDD family membrane protein YckC